MWVCQCKYNTSHDTIIAMIHGIALKLWLLWIEGIQNKSLAVCTNGVRLEQLLLQETYFDFVSFSVKRSFTVLDNVINNVNMVVVGNKLICLTIQTKFIICGLALKTNI